MSTVEEANVVVEEANVVVEEANVVVEEANVTVEEANVVIPSHEIKIVRFELYPKEQPTCYCVGFSVTCNNQHIYRDTQVPLETAAQCGCENDIAQKAYHSLKDSLETWIRQAATKPAILGQTFTPM